MSTDRTVRFGDVSADISPDGTVTIAIGKGENQTGYLQMDTDHALRLGDVLAALTDWGGGE